MLQSRSTDSPIFPETVVLFSSSKLGWILKEESGFGEDRLENIFFSTGSLSHSRKMLPALDGPTAISCNFILEGLNIEVEWSMRQVPLERDINIDVNGSFLVRNLHHERPFMSMLISCSRGTCLIQSIISWQKNMRGKFKIEYLLTSRPAWASRCHPLFLPSHAAAASDGVSSGGKCCSKKLQDKEVVIKGSFHL